MFTERLQELKKIKKRLQAELEDENLPGQRKEEVLSCLYYLDCWIKEKKAGTNRDF